MMDTINKNELYHYGVKGMKWGVRRYQNDDGSLTNMGKVRYGVDASGQMSKKGTKLYNKHRQQYLKNPDKISMFEKQYQKTFDKMKNKGLSDVEAGVIASGKVRNTKCLIGIGAVTVSALTAVGISRYIEQGRDYVIKAGDKMQTVHKGSAEKRIAKGKAFYMSFTKEDNAIYSSKLFSHTTEESKITKFVSEKDIKVANIKNSRKMFEELMRTDPKFHSSVINDEHLKGKTGKELYEGFNYQLVLRDKQHAARSKIYYDYLKKKGYGGVIDNNDAWSHGFTHKPTILFGNEKKKIVSSTKALTGTEDDEVNVYVAQIYNQLRKIKTKPINAIVKPAAKVAGAATVSNIMSTKFVQLYKKAHPNTRLTSSEIAKMHEKSIKNNRRK